MEIIADDTVEIMVVCEQCYYLKGDLAACMCENSQPHQVGRRREITPLGMYLKELKVNRQKNGLTLKVNLKGAFKEWKEMSEEKKAKYKELSILDKEEVKSGNINRGKKDDDDEKSKKKGLKNKADRERMASDRQYVKMLLKDFTSAKAIAGKMIAEKRAVLLSLEKDISEGQDKKENLSRVLTVSEKLVEVKIEKLKKMKKEYRELFSRHRSSGNPH